MKIIQTKLRNMPSSLLAELGSYRYSVFARGEGWSIPSRLTTPGQEYDRFDRSEVDWLIAWSAQGGICGCVRLLPWKKTDAALALSEYGLSETDKIWEMSRFSARIELDQALPLHILWHAVQLARQNDKQWLLTSVTPMLEEMFTQHQVSYEPISPGIIQSEDNLFAVRIPVDQPALAEKFHGARRFTPEEVLPSLGVSISWGHRGG